MVAKATTPARRGSIYYCQNTTSSSADMARNARIAPVRSVATVLYRMVLTNARGVLPNRGSYRRKCVARSVPNPGDGTSSSRSDPSSREWRERWNSNASLTSARVATASSDHNNVRSAPFWSNNKGRTSSLKSATW